MYVHQIVKGAFLFLIRENRILLYKRNGTTHFEGYFGVISGNVEQNETYKIAIIREVEEEIGIIIKQNELKAVYVMHRIDKEDESVYVFFVSEKWLGEIENREPQKCEQLSWELTDELPQNIVPYVKDAIDNYRNNIYFSEYRWQ